MARTLDPAAHAARRDAYLDAAARLIQVRGYEQVSLQDVIDEVGASKGAFYHYFDSRGALLEAVVLRMVEAAAAAVEPVLTDPGRTALDKLNTVFDGLAGYKEARRELMLAVMQSWMSEDNLVVRARFRRAAITRMTPLYAGIIAQGVAEGSFHTADPARCARVFAALTLDANEAASELLLSLPARQTLADIVATLQAFGTAFERVLGAAPGCLRFDRALAVLHEWFDTDPDGRPHLSTPGGPGGGFTHPTPRSTP